MTTDDRSLEQRVLDAEHDLDQLAHKLHRAGRDSERATAMAHKLAWIALFEALVILWQAWRLFAGAA